MIFWALPLIILVIAILLSWKRVTHIENSKQTHLCFICEKPLSDSESFLYNGHSFCSTHIDTYKSNNWRSIFKLTCTPDRPENGVIFYEYKLLLISNSIDAYIVSDYVAEDNEVLTTMEIFVDGKKEEEARRLLPIFD